MSGSFLRGEEVLQKRPDFTTTHWSVVASAGNRESPEAETALAKLCNTYWYPLYAFVRRRGYDVHDAQDLTQEFFTRLLRKDFLRGADRTKGKFRSFLLAAFQHFLAKEWRRAHAQKRGGHCAFVSMDAELAENQYLDVPGSELSPDQVFERQWAVVLLEQALRRLGEEFAASGKAAMFEEIQTFLMGERRASYAELTVKLGMTEGALKMAVSRMRQRFREFLKLEVAETVTGPEEIEEELRTLLKALST